MLCASRGRHRRLKKSAGTALVPRPRIRSASRFSQVRVGAAVRCLWEFRQAAAIVDRGGLGRNVFDLGQSDARGVGRGRFVRIVDGRAVRDGPSRRSDARLRIDRRVVASRGRPTDGRRRGRRRGRPAGGPRGRSGRDVRSGAVRRRARAGARAVRVVRREVAVDVVGRRRRGRRGGVARPRAGGLRGGPQAVVCGRVTTAAVLGRRRRRAVPLGVGAKADGGPRLGAARRVVPRPFRGASAAVGRVLGPRRRRAIGRVLRGRVHGRRRDRKTSGGPARERRRRQRATSVRSDASGVSQDATVGVLRPGPAARADSIPVSSCHVLQEDDSPAF